MFELWKISFLLAKTVFFSSWFSWMLEKLNVFNYCIITHLFPYSTQLNREWLECCNFFSRSGYVTWPRPFFMILRYSQAICGEMLKLTSNHTRSLMQNLEGCKQTRYVTTLVVLPPQKSFVVLWNILEWGRAVCCICECSESSDIKSTVYLTWMLVIFQDTFLIVQFILHIWLSNCQISNAFLKIIEPFLWSGWRMYTWLAVMFSESLHFIRSKNIFVSVSLITFP